MAYWQCSHFTEDCPDVDCECECEGCYTDRSPIWIDTVSTLYKYAPQQYCSVCGGDYDYDGGFWLKVMSGEWVHEDCTCSE